MKKIANIVYETELTNHKKQDWIDYVKYDPSMSGRIGMNCNFALPTLIVGWKLFKTEFAHLPPNILVKHYNKMPHLTWTFNVEERIVDHFNDIEEFIKTAPRKFVEIKPYRNIDPVRNNILTEEELIDQLVKHINPYHSVLYLYKDEMIYIYDKTKFQITGIYLTAFNYFKFDTNKIVSMLCRIIPEKQQFLDKDAQMYQSYYRIMPDFDQLKRSMVLFLQ